MAAENSRVLDLFLELAAIPSPSGHEREVAARVASYLAELGLRAEPDEAGNLLARLEPMAGNGAAPIFLCAHMDTVPPEGPIEPVVEDGVVRNARPTILGADDKAAVAAILETARRLRADQRPHGEVELLFTVREEVGLEGAKAFDTTRLRSRIGFVFDYSGRVGDIVVAAPSGRTVDAVFKGRAAHAGISPEEGRSAIAAAAKAVADMRLGRIDEETTANVGTIQGGSARNVVPERCELRAEARSRDERKLAELVEEMLECFTFAASVAECEVETTVEEKYRGYRLARDEPAFERARGALQRAGLDPRPVEVGGGADANVFRERGIACVNLATGMTQVHTPEEHIAVADIEALVAVGLELVHAA
jgi:tripeptide aminopeptidase